MRETSLKRAECYKIKTIWHSGKLKTREMVQRSVDTRRRGEQVQHRGFLRQWNYSVWHCTSGHMTQYVCPNPQKEHYQERAQGPQWTSANSDGLIKVHWLQQSSHRYQMLVFRKQRKGVGCLWELSVLPVQFFSKCKLVLINQVLGKGPRGCSSSQHP
jgi:hypothetical protein